MTHAATLRVSVGQYSCRGRKSVNQDSLGVRIPEGPAAALKGVALAVADGISSSPVSQLAAEAAVTSLLNDYYSTPEAWTVKTSVSRVLSATNSWLVAQGQAAQVGDVNRGFVCTLSALILKGREAHLFHVGDSRIARLVDTSLEPLTEDHVVVGADEARYLGRALGVRERLEIDYLSVPLNVGDVLVLTTDGVHDFIDGARVAAALGAGELDAAAQAIVEAAHDAGSDDNLTVQLVRIDALPEPDAPPVFDDGWALPVLPTPRVGDVVDGFEILRPLSASDRSHVFLARAPDGRQVALKTVATEARQDEAFLRRFSLEEWVANRLDSPHVLKTVAPEGPRSALYTTTEYVDGTTLRQWMTDHEAPDLEAVRDIIGQIVRGVRALHRREMLHQDLRPENVMIDRAGTVKIIDLGSVAVAGVEEFSRGVLGVEPGTLQYTAPEYLSGDVVSWRSDQFAIGVMAYEMLTGRLPYATRVSQVRDRRDQMRLTYTPAEHRDRPVPVWIDEALKRATHPDPLRRYPALSEFVTDLHRPSRRFENQRRRPLAERNPVRFWQGIALLLALVVVALWYRLSTLG